MVTIGDYIIHKVNSKNHK